MNVNRPFCSTLGVKLAAKDGTARATTSRIADKIITIFFMVKTSFPKWVIRHHLLFDLIDAFCDDEKSSV